MNIKQLAKHLGLSITTVSRALHGYDDVAEKTRERVVQAAKEFNYYPNANAQRLKKSKTRTVGFMLSTFTSGFDNPFFNEMLKGVGEELAKRKYNLLISLITSKSREMPELKHLVEGKLVDAIILIRTQNQDPRIKYLLERGMPFVSHGRTDVEQPFAWLDTNGEAMMYDITKRLIDFGHKDILPVMPITNFNFKFDRINGYLKAMEEAGLSVDEERFVQCKINEESSYKCILEKAEEKMPTAYICFSDIMAYGVIRALKEKGHQIGKTISVTGCDNLTFSSYLEPPLTTIGYDIKLSGKMIVDFIFKLQEGVPIEELNHILKHKIVDGESDGPVSH